MLKVNTRNDLMVLQNIIDGEILSISEKGFVEMTLINKPNIRVNQLMADIIMSPKVFGFELSRNAVESILNQDNNEDERFKYRPDGKPKRCYPPVGFDGYVIINPDIQHKELGSERILSLEEIALHEMMECWAKVRYELQYVHAHSFATSIVKIWLGEK